MLNRKEYLKGYALCRRPLVGSSGCLLGVWCLHFNFLGDNFGTLGASEEAILALRDPPGGLWEQQDGFEVVVYRFYSILG